MTTDAISSDLCYTVCFISYLPGNPNADCFPISVTRSAKVQDLALKIRDEPNIRSELETKKLCLFKVKFLCGEVSIVPEEKVYNTAVEWLSEHVTNERLRMQSVFRLERYFPDGPALEEKYLIDVIAVPDPTLQALFRPSTPENQTFATIEPTPRKSVKATEELVKETLSGYDAGLREFLAGPVWTDYWEAPSRVDDETAKFIKKLGVPKIDDKPVLLLHNLGNDIVDSTLVNELFTKSSRFLVNTSGSGKTRLLFEGLTRHWGFYFTTIVNDENHRLGSADMMDTIEKFIPGSRRFTNKTATLDIEDQDAAFRSNHYIAERRVYQVLRARALIFEHFLKVAREMYPDRSINEFKKHWLFLQLLPADFLGEDIFGKLSEDLNDASDGFLMMGNHRVHRYLKDLQKTFHLGDDFFLILDEAQRAINSLNGCFRSEQNQAVKRPVLRPITKAWKEATLFPVIVSGTGLSIHVVNEVMDSAVMKINAFARATRTGAFDDENRQREYILRYMPPHLADTDSGRAFLKRAWNYARGRHRFTASLLTQLLKFSFLSPHRILNAFIERSCGFIPSDGQRFIEKEPQIDCLQEIMGNIKLLDFSKLTNDVLRYTTFSNILHTWLILRERTRLAEEFNDLVELGFARFVDSGGTGAYVDEPIVLLAAARHFDTVGVPLDRSFQRAMDNAQGNKGYNFETSIAYYLACAFDDTTNLCDIFRFGGGTPDWARHPAELVSIVLDGNEIEANRFHLQEYIGSTAAIGINCTTLRKTMEWLDDPTSVMCFPDNLMGPDIIFFIRLFCGAILAILVQCKYRDKDTLDKVTLDAAVKSLDVSQLYQRSRLQSLTSDNARSGRECALRLFNRIKVPSFNNLASDGWFEDGVPVLKVIASQADSTPPPFHATLDRDRYEQKAEQARLQEKMALSFGSKRVLEEDFTSTSYKKPRT
ncbi:hypothetical protein ACEPAH_1858 [Sanghuangporus vaninii]